MIKRNKKDLYGMKTIGISTLMIGGRHIVREDIVSNFFQSVHEGSQVCEEDEGLWS